MGRGRAPFKKNCHFHLFYEPTAYVYNGGAHRCIFGGGDFCPPPPHGTFGEGVEGELGARVKTHLPQPRHATLCNCSYASMCAMAEPAVAFLGGVSFTPPTWYPSLGGG